MKHFIRLFVLVGLIALCGPPKIFAAANDGENATTTVVAMAKNFLGFEQLSATVAAGEQPCYLPEYKVEKNYSFIDLASLLPATIIKPNLAIAGFIFKTASIPIVPGNSQTCLATITDGDIAQKSNSIASAVSFSS